MSRRRRALWCAVLGLAVAVLSAEPARGQRPDSTRAADPHAGHGAMGHGTGPSRMPPMPKGMRMPPIPGMQGVVPRMKPYLPGQDRDPATFPLAVPRKLVELRDGDSLTLTAGMVRRRIKGRDLIMFGFNGQYPGPMIRVRQSATITVRFRNELDLPSAVHWHGIRLENRFDGAVGVTQDPVAPGGEFLYRVTFPDPGIYWYHPHVREDIQQDLGLYGNMVVESPEPDYYNPANHEQILMLDDLLIDDEGILPYGADVANYAIMGRFGNLFLVNGEPDYRLEVKRGDVVRFLLTNVANTRTLNLDFGGNPIKLVAAFGIDVRNADGLIVISDTQTGFWAFKMDGFEGWNGHDWAMPNISSAQDWDNGPEGAPKKATAAGVSGR